MTKPQRKGMMSSLRTDWATPWKLFEILDREFQFTLDACANRHNKTACPRHLFSEEVDSLNPQLAWDGVVWCNPPYGRDIGRWIEKAFRESGLGATVVMLLPARTDTSWWHEYVMKGEIRFLQGRLNFDDTGRARAPFPSAIVIFRAAQ